MFFVLRQTLQSVHPLRSTERQVQAHLISRASREPDPSVLCCYERLGNLLRQVCEVGSTEEPVCRAEKMNGSYGKAKEPY